MGSIIYRKQRAFLISHFVNIGSSLCLLVFTISFRRGPPRDDLFLLPLSLPLLRIYGTINDMLVFKRFKSMVAVIFYKIVNFILINVLFFQFKWNISVLERSSVLFRGRTVNIYIYNSTNIIQIQNKLIINYAMQTQYQTNMILKFKMFLNSQD